jgi:potassium-dependent mechanosensitive channel
MSSHSRATGSRFATLLRVITTLVIASAICAAAQNPLTQLVTGKKPAPSASPASNPPAAPLQPPTPLPAAIPQIIPLPEVAMKSEQLTLMLANLSAGLPKQDDLKALSTAIKDHGATLEAKRTEAEVFLAGTPSSIELREQENYWRGFQTVSSDWRKQLMASANAAQKTIDSLDEVEPQWSATLEAYKSEGELEPLLELIRQNLGAIRKLRLQASDELQFLVKMQITVGGQDQAASDVLAQLTSAQQVFAEDLLQRDSLPFWQLGTRREQGENPTLYRTATSRWISITAFAREHSTALVLLLLLLVVSLACSYRLHLLARGAPGLPQQAEAYLLLGRWVALGFLAPLLIAYVLAPTAPLSLIGLVILLSFFPILRLLAPLLGPRPRFILYCLAAYYAFTAAISWTPLPPVLKREVGFLGTVALFLSLVYLLRPTRRLPADAPLRRNTMLVFGARLATATLGASLLSNLLGYVRLAQYLGLACIYSGFIGVSMYAGARVYITLLNAVLNLPQAERLAIARLRRDALLRWVPRILVATAILVWLSATLDLLRVRDQVKAAVDAVLGFHIAGSASEITLGSVLGFFLMLAVGYAVASGIRFLLREEVFNRLHLSRGLPDLIASTIYYLLLLMVFLTAVNAGGIDLNKFTLLTGALGVGFGFGMQNIINNFVSGLILQFERPIHINDVLEVEGYTGKVTRIGIRSSTLQTFQGAEVIIPNANFISGKVVNWTLTESRRRAELPLGVAYGTEPDVVLNFLLDAANKHESVLTEPPPMAYFVGFGDSTLNFELQFWVMQDSNWVRVRSDIAMAVMKCLEDAGIEIPFPQRDLHLRTVSGEAATPELADSLLGNKRK